MGARVAIKGYNKYNEFIVTFKKEHDGTYTKITKKMTRDRSDSTVKYHKKDNPVIEEGPFRVVNQNEDFDEKMQFEDWDGEKAFLYFKKIIAEE
tara:strand:- start:150 stop:431 length:282 start_codon:yes stop_codon:yes gene_type:complete